MKSAKSSEKWCLWLFISGLLMVLAWLAVLMTRMCDFRDYIDVLKTTAYVLVSGSLVSFVLFWLNSKVIDESLGRMRRLHYFGKYLFYSFVAGLMVAGFFAVATPSSSEMAAQFMGLMVSPYLAQLFVFPYCARRLHDIGWTVSLAKWQTLLALLALSAIVFQDIGIFIMVIGCIPNLILYFIVQLVPGTADANKYGENPRKSAA